MDRLQRVSDLFTEGKEVPLGADTDGTQVVVWVNKANAFDREEAVRDATVRRAERMGELGDDSSEIRGLHIEMSLWSDEELRRNIVAADDDTIYVETLNDLSTDPEFRELEDFVRRAPELQADDHVDLDDPRTRTLADKAAEYSRRLSEAVEKATNEKLADLESEPREKLERVYTEQWRKARTMQEFMGARRLTEIYLAVRDCSATLTMTEDDGVWDHSACDHSKRLFTSRESIRRMPDEALARIGNAINELMMSPRDAGNSDAPASSSASSERSSTPEDQSTPSSPAETPSAAPTT